MPCVINRLGKGRRLHGGPMKEFSKWTIAKLKSEIRNIRLDCLTLPGSDVHHSMQTPVGIQRRLVSCNQSTSECAVDCRRTRSIFSSREKALHRCVVPAVPSPAPGSPARSDLIFRISDLSFAIVHFENSFVGRHVYRCPNSGGREASLKCKRLHYRDT